MYTNDQPQVIFKSLEYSIRELYIYLGKYSEYLSIDKKKCLRNSKTIKIYKQKKEIGTESIPTPLIKKYLFRKFSF